MKWQISWRATILRWLPARRIGDRGEAAAAWYLRLRGYVIVARQARDRFGEIDLVAVHRRTIVFVEVKTRRHGSPQDALSAITVEKQRRISAAALKFLRRHDLLECAARFDAIAVIWPRHKWWPDITHVPNAFEVQGPASLFN